MPRPSLIFIFTHHDNMLLLLLVNTLRGHVMMLVVVLMLGLVVLLLLLCLVMVVAVVVRMMRIQFHAAHATVLDQSLANRYATGPQTIGIGGPECGHCI